MKSLGHKCPKYYNPTDFFINLLLEDKEKILVCSWEKSGLSKKLKEIVSGCTNIADTTNTILHQKYSLSAIGQIACLAKRDIINLVRDPRIYLGGICQTIFFGLLMGSLYFQMDQTYSTIRDRFGLIFFICINQAFVGLAYIPKYFEERPLFLRERASGTYKIFPYFLSKTITQIPAVIIFPWILSSITYWMTGLNPLFQRYLIFSTAIMLHSIVSITIFDFLAALSPTAELALFLPPILVVLFALFGGFLIALENIPVYYRWFSYLSIFKYTILILVSNEFSDQYYRCNDFTEPCENITYYNQSYTLAYNNSNYTTIYSYSGNGEIETVNVDDLQIWHCYLILIAMIFFYRVGTFFAVYFLHKEKR
jgi:ATP-binding cassette subfamily G (WHITE) protein 2